MSALACANSRTISGLFCGQFQSFARSCCPRLHHLTHWARALSTAALPTPLCTRKTVFAGGSGVNNKNWRDYMGLGQRISERRCQETFLRVPSSPVSSPPLRPATLKLCGCLGFCLTMKWNGFVTFRQKNH